MDKKYSNAFSIASICRILNVCRSGYYEWTHNSRSKRAEQDKRIKTILERQGIVISRRRTIRLMKEANLVCKTKLKFTAITDSNHKLPVAPNLLARQFKVDVSNLHF